MPPQRRHGPHARPPMSTIRPARCRAGRIPLVDLEHVPRAGPPVLPSPPAEILPGLVGLRRPRHPGRVRPPGDSGYGRAGDELEDRAVAVVVSGSGSRSSRRCAGCRRLADSGSRLAGLMASLANLSAIAFHRGREQWRVIARSRFSLHAGVVTLWGGQLLFVPPEVLRRTGPGTAASGHTGSGLAEG